MQSEVRQGPREGFLLPNMMDAWRSKADGVGHR